MAFHSGKEPLSSSECGSFMDAVSRSHSNWRPPNRPMAIGNTMWRFVMKNLPVSARESSRARRRTNTAGSRSKSWRGAAADPGNSESQLELAAGYNELGNVSWAAGLVDQARESFQHAFDAYARRAAANPKDRFAVSHVDQSCANLAGVARSRGDFDTAEKICQRGIALLTQLGVKPPPVKPYRKSMPMPAMNSELRDCAEARLLSGPLDSLLKQPANQLSWLLYNRVGLLASAGTSRASPRRLTR